MVGLGSLVSGAIGGVAQIIGGNSARKKMKRAEGNINDLEQKNEDWYNRRYNEDATQRADAQAILNQTRDFIREQNRSAAGSQAVMGGTEESVAATKAANAKALSDAASNIAINADARKDQIENQYMQTNADLVGKENELLTGQAQSIAQATQNAGDAASSVARELLTKSKG